MNNKTNTSSVSENLYTWKFNDKKNRGSLWYIIALSIVIWLSIWWFLTKQYWMSFIVLLIAWFGYFIENNSEDQVEVEIKELWIKIAWTFYDYSSIDSFWIVYKWENATLLRLNLNRRGLRHIDVKIDNNLASDLKNILTEYIESAGKINLSLSEKIIQLLKL